MSVSRSWFRRRKQWMLDLRRKLRDQQEREPQPRWTGLDSLEPRLLLSASLLPSSVTISPTPYNMILPVGMTYQDVVDQIMAQRQQGGVTATSETGFLDSIGGSGSLQSVLAMAAANETESNNTPATANTIALGFDGGEDSSFDISGTIGNPAAITNVGPFTEDNGSITLANTLAITSGQAVRVAGTIGDGPFGNSSGDFDFYRISNVQIGETIHVHALTPGSALDSIVAIYDSAGNLLGFNDDNYIGGFDLDAIIWHTAATAGDYYVAIGGFRVLNNDAGNLPSNPFNSASGPGQASEGTYSAIIGLNHGDYDYYRVELNAGDVIGANVSGGATRLTLHGSNGALLMGSQRDFAASYPEISPLPGGGNASLAWVVSQTGTYYVGVNNGSGAYTLNMRLFRTELEQQIIGSKQTLYLDFDGAAVATSIFGEDGIAELSPLVDFLPRWGLQEPQLDAVINSIISVVQQNFNQIRTAGNNGDFLQSGINGQYDIQILNSRDHPDAWGLPNVSRVIIGGTIAELGISTIGIAQSLDPGNFATQETGVVLLDLLSASSNNPNSLNQYSLAPNVSIIDLIGVAVGNIATHEAGHFFGARHTDQYNNSPQIMDQGGNLAKLIGLNGNVWGVNNTEVDFGTDSFVRNEGYEGKQDSVNVMSFGLSTGTTAAILAGPRVLSIAPRPGVTFDLAIDKITVVYTEDVTAGSAGDVSNYVLTYLGDDELFGTGDDEVIALTATVTGPRIVELSIDPNDVPLDIGFYRLRVRGNPAGIVDLDGNPLNSVTGPGGGSDHIHEFQVFESESTPPVNPGIDLVGSFIEVPGTWGDGSGRWVHYRLTNNAAERLVGTATTRFFAVSNSAVISLDSYFNDAAFALNTGQSRDFKAWLPRPELFVDGLYNFVGIVSTSFVGEVTSNNLFISDDIITVLELYAVSEQPVITPA